MFGAVGFGASLLVDKSVRVVFSASVSLFVAGIAFIVQFLYEIEQRLEQMEEAYHTQAKGTIDGISDGFKKINEATELYGLVEASALKTDAVTQLVRNSTRIKASPAILFDFAQSEIARLSDTLKTLSDGADVIYEGEDRDWMLGLARATKSTIDATSLSTVDAGGRGFVDGGLWASDLGQRYLDVQSDAIRRGVVIRRLFIMDRSELLTDPDFVNVCRTQRDIGIKVRTLDPSRIPGPRRDSLFDFIIFDGVLSYQATPASWVGDRSRPIIVNTRMVTQLSAVTDRIQRFSELWLAGGNDMAPDD
jgi:hypothetical protein